MTQQPYSQPQYPQYPQQPPVQQYPPQQPVYPQAPPQQYGQPPYAPAPQQQAPAQPLAAGSLDEFYSQPSASTGPSISFKDKPIGTAYAGIVTRDVTNADVQQMTDFNTKAPLFYRDGRPKFAMKVPLRVQPSPEFPEGEASWYVKGQARDELVRAMSEAGATEASPVAGATIVVRLVGKRSSGAGLNPANVFQVEYVSPGGQPVQQPAAQPVQQQAPQPVQQPVAVAPSPVTEPVQQYAQVPQQQPVQQYAQAPQPQAPAPVASVQQPSPPSGLSDEQAALLAKLTGGQPAA